MKPGPPRAVSDLDARFDDDPWAARRGLRQHAPLRRDTGTQLWGLTRHADVAHVLRNPELLWAAVVSTPEPAR